MDDAAGVRGADRVGEWNGDLEQAVERKAVARNPIAQRRPLDQLHRQEVDVSGLLNGVNGDDVGMIECGSRARLLLEAPQPIRVGSSPRVEGS